MSSLSQLQALVRTAVGNASYDATAIAGHLNNGVREAAGRVRLPGLSATYQLPIAYKRGGGEAFTFGSDIQIYSVAHGFTTGDFVFPTVDFGTTELNGNMYRVTKVDANNFKLDNTTITAETGYTAWPKKTVGGITLVVGDPVLITSTVAHGFTTGDIVYFGSVGGTVELNGNSYTVTVTGLNTFTLDDTVVTATNYTAWGAGGSIYASATFMSPSFALPADFDFHRLENLLRVYSANQDGDLNLMDSWARFILKYPVLDETGDIYDVCVSRGRLWFHPMPTSDTLTLYYQRVPTDMSAAGDQPDAIPAHLHTGLLVNYAAWQIYEEQGQLELAERRRQYFEKYMGELWLFVGPDDTLPNEIEDEGDDWYV